MSGHGNHETPDDKLVRAVTRASQREYSRYLTEPAGPHEYRALKERWDTEPVIEHVHEHAHAYTSRGDIRYHSHPHKHCVSGSGFHRNQNGEHHHNPSGEHDATTLLARASSQPFDGAAKDMRWNPDDGKAWCLTGKEGQYETVAVRGATNYMKEVKAVANTAPTPSMNIDADVVKAKIPTIKALRILFGIGLAEAKALAEAIQLRYRPDLSGSGMWQPNPSQPKPTLEIIDTERCLYCATTLTSASVLFCTDYHYDLYVESASKREQTRKLDAEIAQKEAELLRLREQRKLV